MASALVSLNGSSRAAKSAAHFAAMLQCNDVSPQIPSPRDVYKHSRHMFDSKHVTALQFRMNLMCDTTSNYTLLPIMLPTHRLRAWTPYTVGGRVEEMYDDKNVDS